jgi:hypothetical protein
MEIKKPDIANAPQEEMGALTTPAIGEEQLKQFTQILNKYHAGLSQTKSRIIASENWWKLRNTVEEQKESEVGSNGGFKSVSGWLHNVITSKHADAMEAYPEPNVLPREAGDRAEARMLTAILPCVFEQNHFERTYSDNMWDKCKFGTGVYKVVWDSSKLNGLGDISIEAVSLLNLYWEPGITDIQKSRYFFHTEMVDKEILEQMYPQTADKLKGTGFLSSTFQYDDSVETSDKATVIDVYYHKFVEGRNTLQYCKYVNDVVLFASENEIQPITDDMGNVIKPPMAITGLYDHALYPYIFDPLFPIEGSPCGYGYVDISRNPQTEIDLMKTAFVKNTMAGATPRYFSRNGAGINEDEFLDTSKPIVHCTNVDDLNIRPVDYKPLDGNYLNMLHSTIQELRETSGNTETSNGVTNSGVTAASAIVALQQASGKGSRDSTMSAYRAYGQLVEICIELIRQFYDMPRKFRILGQYGSEQYVTYSNANIQPRHQGVDFGQDMGYTQPIFDVKISAQKKNVYTKISQNEMAIQFFKMGFFNPQQTDQTLMCLDLMEFDGKDALMQKVAQNGTMFDKLTQYMQLALMLAAETHPEMVQGISNDIMQTVGAGGMQQMSAAPSPIQSDNINGIQPKENARVANARAQSSKASQPD